MTTLVTGGSGFLGAHLVRALLAKGRRVRCLVRREHNLNLEGLEVELVRGDLLDAASLRSAVRGCSTVFHCAADYRLYARRAREIYAVNVGGTRRMLAACLEHGVERVVVTSSVGALASSKHGVVATEETPVCSKNMVGHYKRSKFLAEQVVQKAVADGQSVLLAHPSTPVGELDCKPTPTGRIIVDFLGGRIPATVHTGLNFVDVKDVAAGHLLVEEKGVPGRRYILGAENLSLRAFLGLVAKVSGRPPVRWRVPHILPLVVGAVDTGLARILGSEPKVALEAVLMARKTMFFDCHRARQELGYRPGPLEDAVVRAVQYFSKQGAGSRVGRASGAGQ